MAGRRGGIRLAVLDDGLFVRTQLDDVRPLSATFNRFVEAVGTTGAFETVRYVVPVRQLRIWEVEPALDPVDESIVEVVPTTFFSGIADYLLRAGWVALRNWPIIERAVADADLLWLRLPASNGLLALAAARRHGVPYFGWLAGSAGDVAAAQRRMPPLAWAARAVGAAYDAVSRLAADGAPLITLDAEMFASVVSAAEVEATLASASVPSVGAPRRRVVWSGRMAGEKGLVELVQAVRRLNDTGLAVTLVLIGDGPARPAVERELAALPAEAVEDYGYVADRTTYMELLRSGELYVLPSRAEGVPKVLVEAMAAGLPVVARDAGAVAGILGHGDRGRLVSGGADELATAMRELLEDDAARRELRQRGLAWAADHTAEAQARRLAGWLRNEFPELDWPG